jgi:hypothetical protein
MGANGQFQPLGYVAYLLLGGFSFARVANDGDEVQLIAHPKRAGENVGREDRAILPS